MLALAAVTLVVCAPGQAGTSAEAQPTMDALAGALSAEAKLPAGSVHAVYDQTEAGCLRRLAKSDAGLLLATLPFFLAHEKDLKLTPRLLAVPLGRDALEQWTLAAAKSHPPKLHGYEVHSSAGYSKRFVRAMAPGLPEDVEIVAAPSVLSSLRRAAAGEKVALLLDGQESYAAGRLPISNTLSALESSPAVPVAVVSTVGKRVSAKQWSVLADALQRMGDDPAAREALQGARLSKFAPLDEAALAEARKAYRSAR